jgi:RNA polymerase sigma-70 factor (ECF subfamily)
VPEPNDQRFVNDLRAGCTEACAELVHGHYEKVYRFLLHLTRDVHAAEDLTQETFATAWEKLATFQARAAIGTWLHRIAYTKFIDARRAEGRAAVLRDNLPEPPVSPVGPVESMMADEEAQRLYQLLYSLDISERTVLVLHYLQGLSYREMASVLDEASGTVKWRTSEALNRLRALLKEEVPNHAT